MPVPDWLFSVGGTVLGAAVAYGTTRGALTATVEAFKAQISRLEGTIAKVDDAMRPVVERVVRVETKIEAIEEDIRDLAQGHERNRKRIEEAYHDLIGTHREPTGPG